MPNLYKCNDLSTPCQALSWLFFETKQPKKGKKKERKMASELPKELWVWILTFVPVKEVLQHVSLVSSTWNDYSNDPFLWQSFCVKSSGDNLELPSHVKAKLDPSLVSEEALDSKPSDWKAYYRSRCT